MKKVIQTKNTYFRDSRHVVVYNVDCSIDLRINSTQGPMIVPASVLQQLETERWNAGNRNSIAFYPGLEIPVNAKRNSKVFRNTVKLQSLIKSLMY
jgi:hypothetical protein